MVDAKVVRWVGHVRGAGRIAQRNGSKDVSFEGGNFKIGDEVEYEVEKHPAGYNVAVNIKLVEVEEIKN